MSTHFLYSMSTGRDKKARLPALSRVQDSSIPGHLHPASKYIAQQNVGATEFKPKGGGIARNH